MKALTIWQPWASLILIGAKPYEFRSWKPPQWLVGKPLAIHAGARAPKREEVVDLIARLDGTANGTNPCLKPDIALPFLKRCLADIETRGRKLVDRDLLASPSIEPFRLPLSCMLGVAMVGSPKSGDECAREFGTNYGNDSTREGTFNWGWPLEVMDTFLPPIDATGKQGLWDWQTPASASAWRAA